MLSIMFLFCSSVCRANLNDNVKSEELNKSCFKPMIVEKGEPRPLEYWALLVGATFVVLTTICPHLHDKGWHKKDRDL